MKSKLVILAVLCCIASCNFSCSTWESTTFATLSSAKSTIDCANSEYNHNDTQILQNCAGVITPSSVYLPQTSQVHDILLKAGQAKDAAVNAMVTYEASKQAAGSADQTTLQANVNTAVAALSADVASIMALIKTGGK